MFHSVIIATLLRTLPIIFVGLALTLVAAVIGFCCYYQYAHWNDNYWPLRNVPLILRDEFISKWDQFTLKFRAYEIDMQIYRLMKERNLRFAGLMEFRRPIMYIRDLDLIKAITVRDFDHFVNHRKEKPIPESNPSYCIQFGLLLMRNKEWKNLRSVMTPAYSTLKIKRMFELFVESGEGLLDFVSKDTKLRSASGTNVTDLLRRILINTTCSVAFGIDSKSYESEQSIYHKMSQTFEFQFHGFGFLKIYPILLIGKRIIQLEHMKEQVITFFKESIADTIEYRKTHKIHRNDFLNILLETREAAERENKQINLSDDVIFAQCIVFFLAGYINVVVALVYTLYELARNPKVQQKLREECCESLEKEGKFTYERINGMKYLDCVLTEVQRMYSTSGGGVRLERECTKDYQIPGSTTVIPKGTVVIIPNNSIHHDEDIFPQPETFDPSRWTPEFRAQLHPCAYTPFGIGPRVCIAQRYALVQAKTCIAQLVAHYKFEPVASTPFPMAFSKKGNAMRPAKDLYLKISPVGKDRNLS